MWLLVNKMSFFSSPSPVHPPGTDDIPWPAEANWPILKYHLYLPILALCWFLAFIFFQIINWCKDVTFSYESMFHTFLGRKEFIYTSPKPTCFMLLSFLVLFPVPVCILEQKDWIKKYDSSLRWTFGDRTNEVFFTL